MYPGEDRKTFLARVSCALNNRPLPKRNEETSGGAGVRIGSGTSGRTGVSPVIGRHGRAVIPTPPPVDETLIRLASVNDDLPALFTQNAIAVGMSVKRIAVNQVADEVALLIDQHNIEQLIISQTKFPGLDADLTSRNQPLTITDAKSLQSLEKQFDFDAGLTDVQSAFAETGTMICCSSPDHSRGPSLIAPIHIAILKASDILPDMIDHWANVANLSPIEHPSSTVFITGPSKTADIEGILITGVHGPKHVFILLVDDA